MKRASASCLVCSSGNNNDCDTTAIALKLHIQSMEAQGAVNRLHPEALYSRQPLPFNRLARVFEISFSVLPVGHIFI